MHRVATLTALAGLLLACSTEPEVVDAIGLEDAPADDADDAASDDTAPADADDASGDADEGGDAAPAGDVVDGTEAVPGTWQVGDAGTITFAVVDGALVLEDVSEADGWTVTDVEEAPDEIEVDFAQGDVEVVIEVEIVSGGTLLEVEIDTDIENAEPGTYDIGDAGTFTFDVVDGALDLVDVTAADGWEITEQSVDGDDIEIELRSGAMRWDVDVDLNGDVLVELDYEVTSEL